MIGLQNEITDEKMDLIINKSVIQRLFTFDYCFFPSNIRSNSMGILITIGHLINVMVCWFLKLLYLIGVFPNDIHC